MFKGAAKNYFSYLKPKISYWRFGVGDSHEGEKSSVAAD
jgi:hypothetical protein